MKSIRRCWIWGWVDSWDGMGLSQMEYMCAAENKAGQSFNCTEQSWNSSHPWIVRKEPIYVSRTYDRAPKFRCGSVFHA